MCQIIRSGENIDNFKDVSNYDEIFCDDKDWSHTSKSSHRKDSELDDDFSVDLYSDDDELEFDEDETQLFCDRETYFTEDNTKINFDDLSKERVSEVVEIIKKKGSERYRSIHHNEILLNQILISVEKYLTKENLKQVWHEYSTNINENMNYVIANFAPKHRHLSTTFNLHTRVSIAVGT